MSNQAQSKTRLDHSAIAGYLSSFVAFAALLIVGLQTQQSLKLTRESVEIAKNEFDAATKERQENAVPRLMIQSFPKEFTFTKDSNGAFVPPTGRLATLVNIGKASASNVTVTWSFDRIGAENEERLEQLVLQSGQTAEAIQFPRPLAEFAKLRWPIESGSVTIGYSDVSGIKHQTIQRIFVTSVGAFDAIGLDSFPVTVTALPAQFTDNRAP